jgi:hypothetical protein
VNDDLSLNHELGVLDKRHIAEEKEERAWQREEKNDSRNSCEEYSACDEESTFRHCRPNVRVHPQPEAGEACWRLSGATTG